MWKPVNEDKEYELPSYEDLLRHELYDAMHQISESRWCASWMCGLAVTLWYSMLGGEAPVDQECIDLTTLERSRLLKLHGVCGGWFTFDGFVTTEEWLRMLSEGYLD